MVDWSGLLAQKYAIMQQQANADTSRANSFGLTSAAGANLDTVKAGLLPGETAASIAEQQARTAGQLATNATIGPLAQSQIGLQKQQARSASALGGYYDSEATNSNQYNQGSSFADYLARLRANNAASSAGPGGLM